MIELAHKRAPNRFSGHKVVLALPVGEPRENLVQNKTRMLCDNYRTQKNCLPN